MSSKQLLREYIREVLNAADPWARGKDYHGGNLYPTSNGEDVEIRHSTNNVIEDEEQREELDMQDKKRAACCLIIRPDGKILAVSRRDDPTAMGLPGGKVDPGESTMDAAARELQEETGLTATSLNQVFEWEDSNNYINTTFACEVDGEFGTDEEGVIKWVSPETLVAGPFGDYNERLFQHQGIKYDSKK